MKTVDKVQEIKKYLREYAPQVKTFLLDGQFTGKQITTYERKDLGPKGYKSIEQKFEDFDALTKHYGFKSKVKTETAVKRTRGSVKTTGRATKKSVAK